MMELSKFVFVFLTVSTLVWSFGCDRTVETSPQENRHKGGLDKNLIGAWRSVALKTSHDNFPIKHQILIFNTQGKVALVDFAQKSVDPRENNLFIETFVSDCKFDASREGQVFIVNRWFDLSFEETGNPSEEKQVLVLKAKANDEWWEFRYIKIIDT